MGRVGDGECMLLFWNIGVLLRGYCFGFINFRFYGWLCGGKYDCWDWSMFVG